MMRKGEKMYRRMSQTNNGQALAGAMKAVILIGGPQVGKLL